MKPHSKLHLKLTPGEQQQSPLHDPQQKLQSPAAREFPSIEALLRHDAAATPFPSQLAARLQRSLASEPKPPRPWWRRLFSSLPEP